MNSFTTIPKFKFWCQKILPLVYDDSLSYMELLCKVVDYLNKVIEDINNIPDYINSMVSDEKLKEILSELLDELREQIARANEGENTTASFNRDVDELVWLNGKLVRMTRAILAGDRYVEDDGTPDVTGNFVYTSAEIELERVKDNLTLEINAREQADTQLQTNIDNEVLARENADSQLQTTIDNEVLALGNEALARENADNDINVKIGNLSELDTTDKTNIVNAINEILSSKDYITPEDFGAVGDGVTDDSVAFQSMLNADNLYCLLKSGATYKLNSICTITKNKWIIGSYNKIIAPNGFINITTSALRVRLNGLLVEGLNTSPYTGIGIQGYLGNVHAIDVEFKWYDTCMKPNETSSYFSHFDRCTFHQCNIGIEMPNEYNSNLFTSCIFQDCETCIKALSVRQLVFHQCNFERNDIVIETKGSSIVFDSCYLEFNHRFIYIPSTAFYNSKITVSNCYIYISGDNTLNGYLIYSPTVSSVQLEYGCVVEFNGNNIDLRNLTLGQKAIAFFGTYNMSYLVVDWLNNFMHTSAGLEIIVYVQLFDLTIATQYMGDPNRIPFNTDLCINTTSGLLGEQHNNGNKILGKDKIRCDIKGVISVNEQISSKTINLPQYLGVPTQINGAALVRYSDNTCEVCPVAWYYSSLTISGINNQKTCSTITVNLSKTSS